MLNFLGRFLGPLAGLAGKLGLGSLFLGPVAPILTAIGSFIGAVLSAVAEIIGAMARSYEGRWALAIIAMGLAGLYLRWHYIEQGRAEAPVKVVTRTVRLPAPPAPPVIKYVKVPTSCPKQRT